MRLCVGGFTRLQPKPKDDIVERARPEKPRVGSLTRLRLASYKKFHRSTKRRGSMHAKWEDACVAQSSY